MHDKTVSFFCKQILYTEIYLMLLSLFAKTFSTTENCKYFYNIEWKKNYLHPSGL